MDQPPAHAPRPTLILAWVIVLFASLLPEIILRETGLGIPVWFLPLRFALLVVLCLAGFFIPVIRPLRRICLAMAALFAAAWLIPLLNLRLDGVAAWLGGTPFIQRMLPEQINDLFISLIVLLALLLSGLKPEELFLKCGNLKAPIHPVPWMGFPRPESWVSFGGQYSVYLAVGVAAVLYFTSGATLQTMQSVVPLLPVILLMAAINAFNEEALFRSAVLGALEPAVGSGQAWWMSAVLFGVGHFYGVPAGWIGIGLATFMGWILAKAMLETRGFWWSWWIHFLQDVAIFTFLAAGTLHVE
jgi:membrane protease YdiL (CAAX protease family)